MDGGENKIMDYVIGEDLDIWSVILDGSTILMKSGLD